MVIGLIAISPFVNHASAQSVGPSGGGGSTSSYPTNIAYQSCGTYSGYIYCVGGNTGSGPTSAVYYAPVSSSGVGAWTSTTSFPTKVEYQSCATSSGYIYCVGGESAASYPGYTSTVFYADLT